MDDFRSWYTKRHGTYPGEPSELVQIVWMRLADEFAVYVGQVVAALTPEPAEPYIDDPSKHMVEPVMVPIPETELRLLCKLARNAAEDLHAQAWKEYPDKFPSTERRRNRDLGTARELTEAQAAVQKHLHARGRG